MILCFAQNPICGVLLAAERLKPLAETQNACTKLMQAFPNQIIFFALSNGIATTYH